MKRYFILNTDGELRCNLDCVDKSRALLGGGTSSDAQSFSFTEGGSSESEAETTELTTAAISQTTGRQSVKCVFTPFRDT